jgi:hypothetical protein
MKVSKNEDFLGRICAYLSGSSPDAAATAELWPAGIPQPPQPGKDPPRSTEMALAVFEFPGRSGAPPTLSPINRRLPGWSL